MSTSKCVAGTASSDMYGSSVRISSQAREIMPAVRIMLDHLESYEAAIALVHETKVFYGGVYVCLACVGMRTHTPTATRANARRHRMPKRRDSLQPCAAASETFAQPLSS